jgi:hypothetical protein
MLQSKGFLQNWPFFYRTDSHLMQMSGRSKNEMQILVGKSLQFHQMHLITNNLGPGISLGRVLGQFHNDLQVTSIMIYKTH